MSDGDWDEERERQVRRQAWESELLFLLWTTLGAAALWLILNTS